MGPVRMVACDLDGTVVGPGGVMTGRTLAALTACQDAGVAVVFVTGRPPRWMAPVVAATGHRGLAICGNGAVVLDLGADTVVESYGLTPDDVLRVAERLRPVLPGAVFALETLDGYRREPGYVPMHDVARAGTVGPLPELLAGDPTVVKILCRIAVPDPPAPAGGHVVQQLLADEMLARARTVLTGIAEPVHSNPAGGMLEISALGVSKASTLARLAGERGIAAADIVAFGDMPNDVPMLRWAGRGFAMADGHPEAIAAAGQVAPAFAEDGVAQVLERLLSQQLSGVDGR